MYPHNAGSLELKKKHLGLKGGTHHLACARKSGQSGYLTWLVRFPNIRNWMIFDSFEKPFQKIETVFQFNFFAAGLSIDCRVETWGMPRIVVVIKIQL